MWKYYRNEILEPLMDIKQYLLKIDWHRYNWYCRNASTKKLEKLAENMDESINLSFSNALD